MSQPHRRAHRYGGRRLEDRVLRAIAALTALMTAAAALLGAARLVGFG